MTTLATEMLKTTLIETITLTHDRIYHIKGIKPKILMFASPAGTFTLSVKQGATTLASGTFTSASIKTQMDTVDDYVWLNVAVEFDGLVALKKGSYDIELSASGYTYADSSFIGWIKSHENLFNDRADAFVDYTSNPLDVLIYERVREDLTR